MALTAYSIDSCGTIYKCRTTKSHHDRLATDHRSEPSSLHHATTHICRAISELLYRHILLTGSMFTPPPPPKIARIDAL